MNNVFLESNCTISYYLREGIKVYFKRDIMGIGDTYLYQSPLSPDDMICNDFSLDL